MQYSTVEGGSRWCEPEGFCGNVLPQSYDYDIFMGKNGSNDLLNEQITTRTEELSFIASCAALLGFQTSDRE